MKSKKIKKKKKNIKIKIENKPNLKSKLYY